MPAVATSTTMLDSILFRDAFGTPRMREIFSDRALIGRYIAVEIALARAEARCGVIPAEAVDAIARCCDLDALDFDLLRRETDNVGYPILPLVHQLVKQCGEAGRWLHWGATTQDRHAERLAQLAPRVLVGQFAGAAGTLASLGNKGFAVQAALCEELGLGVPVATWHVARDGFAETVNFLGLVTGSLGKIALDLMIMASTEFAEVYEPFVPGRGASSTMPQKRNPISSELMLAAAKGVRQHAGLMLDAMIHDFERATGPWHAEWMAIPESFVLTAGALHQARFALGGLVVDDARMAHNLGLSKGLIVAEAVMMQLAPLIGRQQAHDLVYAACRVVNDSGRTLAEVLADDREVARHFDRAALDRLTDPAGYLGLAPAMVDRVIAQSERLTGP